MDYTCEFYCNNTKKNSNMTSSKIEHSKVPDLPGRFTTYAQGPYTTGCVDIMVGKDKYGTLMRLYYPTSLSYNIQNVSPKDWTRWYLGEKYSEGLARFNMPIFAPFYRLVSNRITCDVLTPAVWEAKIANKKFPLIIFSHGLIAHRSLYSCICNELASHGFIIASVEHRDESGCATFTLHPDGTKNWILINTNFSSKDEYKIRNQQIEIRAKECSRALDLIEKINIGLLMPNELKSKFKMETLKGKFDLTNPIVAGHSFGGVLVPLSLSMDKRFKMGISLDPWMFPLKDDCKLLSQVVQQPILFILMEGFQDDINIEQVNYFQNNRNEIYTVRKGIHQHQVDTAMIFSKDFVFLQRLIGCYTSQVEPAVPLTITNALIMKFIDKYQRVVETEYMKSVEKFLVQHDQYIANEAIGSATTMLGWDTLPDIYRK